MSFPSEDEVATALFDSSWDVQRAVEMLLEEGNDFGSWEETGKKKKKKQERKVQFSNHLLIGKVMVHIMKKWSVITLVFGNDEHYLIFKNWEFWTWRIGLTKEIKLQQKSRCCNTQTLSNDDKGDRSVMSLRGRWSPLSPFSSLGSRVNVTRPKLLHATLFLSTRIFSINFVKQVKSTFE